MRMQSDTKSNAAFDLYWQIIIKCLLQATRSLGAADARALDGRTDAMTKKAALGAWWEGTDT